MRKQIGFGSGMSLILLVFCWLHSQPASALDVNGVISADSRWTSADSPIKITGDVRVDVNATLIIDPGVTVLFQPSPDIRQGYSIRVDGTLRARGNQTQPIIFTAVDRSNPWGAIIFNDKSKDWNPETSAGNTIAYCIIEYGGNEPDGAGMIITFNAMPLIERNLIRFSVAGGISALVSEDPAEISSISGKIRIIENQIYNNATGIRLAAEGGIIQNNFFLNNNRAMELQVRSNDIQISNNTISSSAPEIFGTGIQVFFDEAANGIAVYQWHQTSGRPVSLNNPRSASTNFIASAPPSGLEILSFDLTVTNKNGIESTRAVEVAVTGDNPAPTASAGVNQNIQLTGLEGEEVVVTLTGEGSLDPYLGIIRYSWKQTEGETVNLRGANAVSPTFIVPAIVSAGDRMTFQLTVTDEDGLESTDTVDVYYYDENIFPVAAAGDDQTVSPGDTVILDATGSSDADGSISSFIWVQTAGPPVSLDYSNTSKPYFVATNDKTICETLTFRLQVTDNKGVIATDDISITVNGTLIANPGENQTVSAGDQVILDGSASVDQNASAAIDIENNMFSSDNGDASILALSALENAAFKLNATLNNFITVDNKGYIVYIYNWSSEAPSPIVMPDNWWGTVDSAIIEELIYDQDDNYKLPVVDYQPFEGKDIPGTGSSLPYPPLADAGPDLNTDADHSVTLDGSNSYDPDAIAKYRWEQTDGPVVNLKNADQKAATFISPAGGIDGATLQFQLTVSTDDVFSHSDTVNVAINPDEDLPTVDAGGCFIHSAKSNQNNASMGIGWRAKIFLFFIAVLGGLFRLRRAFAPFIIFLSTFLLLPVPAQAGYLAFGGGGGGDADEINATIETGAKDLYAKKMDFLFGIGVLFIPHSDNELPSSTISLPCPNEDCARSETVRKGTEVGFFGKFGVEIGSSDFYVNAIGGFTAFTESELSKSPATGRTYEESSDSQVEALYGGGISYFIHSKWDFVIQVDYDNIRGATGTIGWYW